MGDRRLNAMQAALDRAAQQAATPPPTPARGAAESPPATSSTGQRFDRPSRRNTKLIGGHFSPKLARQLRILAAEEDTTIQALLEEAIHLLLAKKARDQLRKPVGKHI